MGKQNTPLILGFVNNAAKNTFSVSQKQAQNKNGQKQQSRSVVNKKANTKGTQSFQNWADELPKQNAWNKVVKQQNKAQQQQQQRPKAPQQQTKQVQKQQQKNVPQKQQQKNVPQKQQQKNAPQPTWGWYPASKQEAELKKYYQNTSASTNVQNRQQNRQQQNKQQNRQQQNKPQKMRNAPVMNNKAKRETPVSKRAQMMKREPNIMKIMNNLYDAFNFTFPSENGRYAWISSKKVGGNKVLSVATLFAIRNAPATRSKKAFVERNGQVIFNNNLIRHAVDGRFTGHKKFRGTRVLTYIPEKWFCHENGYEGTNYQKFANINGPKRNERCFSFKGVY